MANKKLGTAAAELKLTTKKDKTAKKPKWQAKIGGRKGKVETPEPVVETPEVEVDKTPIEHSPSQPPEPTESPVVATTPEAPSVEPTTTDEGGNDWLYGHYCT